MRITPFYLDKLTKKEHYYTSQILLSNRFFAANALLTPISKFPSSQYNNSLAKTPIVVKLPRKNLAIMRIYAYYTLIIEKNHKKGTLYYSNTNSLST